MQPTTEQKILDPATEIRKVYVRETDAAWPMTSVRLDSIYNTVKRTLRSSGVRDPETVWLTQIFGCSMAS
jgi:hypothetical protein